MIIVILIALAILAGCVSLVFNYLTWRLIKQRNAIYADIVSRYPNHAYGKGRV